jgi:hypothetical protein
MQAGKRSLVSWRTLAGVSAVLAVVTLGMLLVDTRAAISAAIGIAFAWCGLALLTYFRTRPSESDPAKKSRTRRTVVIVTALVLLAGLIVGAWLITLWQASQGDLPGAAGGSGGGGGSTVGYCRISYEAGSTALVFDGSNLASGSVTLEGKTTGDEVVTYYGNTQNMDPNCPPEGKHGPVSHALSPQPVDSHNKGWLLHEVSLPAYALSTDPQLKSYDSSSLDQKVSVTLRNFPAGVFFQARAATNVQTTTYVDAETVRWEQGVDANSGQDLVTFSYITPGWQFARPVLNLYYGVQSANQLVVGAAGTVSTLAVSIVFDLALGHYVKEPLDNLIFKSGKVMPRKKKAPAVKTPARKQAKTRPTKPDS